MFNQKFFASAIVLGLAGLATFASALAQDPNVPESTPLQQTASNEVVIPACLAKLTLTNRQETQIREIISDYEKDLSLVWDQFGVRYLDTIRTEALLLAAIEDKLTDGQRNQVRE